VLRNNANLSTGGSATDVTDEVHPELAARAIEAARTIGLDICGVDVVCRNGAQAAGRAVGRHRRSQRRPRSAHAPRAVLRQGPPGGRSHHFDACFGTGDDGRIPVVAVAGTNGKTTTVRLIAHLMTQTGLRVGMTNDRWRVRRRRMHRHRRLQRSEERPQCAGASGCRWCRARNRAWRRAARRPRLRPLPDRCGDQYRQRRPSRPRLHQHRRRPCGGQARRRAERRAEGHGGAECRRPHRRGHGRALSRARSPSLPPTAHASGAGDAPRARRARHLRRGRRTGRRRKQQCGAHPAFADRADPRRQTRLSGRERDGRTRRRLGARSRLVGDPHRTGRLRVRCRQRARPLQHVRLPRRDGDRRLRPQP
jgi:hypothetical protein